MSQRQKMISNANQNQRQRQTKKRKNTTKKKTPRPPVRTRTVVPRSRFHLSECSRLYAAALFDPFGEHELPCIPDLNELPSYKIRTLIRSVMYVGTEGFGYVAYSPKSMTKDAPTIVQSGKAYNQIWIEADPAIPGVQVVSNQQFPYTNAEMTSGNNGAGRLVAGGIRIRYAGTELNRGGTIIRYRGNNNQSNGLDQFQAASILAKQTAKQDRTGEGWYGINYQPMSPVDYTYVVGSYAGQTNGDNYTTAIVVTGGVPGNAYDVEAVFYHELINEGSSALPNLSRSHVDVPGMSAIKNSFQMEGIENPGPSYFNRMVKAISEYSAEDVSTFATNAITAANTLKAFL